MASGLLVGLADAFAVSRRHRLQRLLLASVAGLAHTTFLVLFSVLELFVAPTVGAATYVPLYLLFGLFLGAELSYVYPVLGTTRSTSEQLKTSAWVTLLLWAAAVPLVIFTYREQALFMLPFLLGFTAALAFGVGFALSDRRKRIPSARA